MNECFELDDSGIGEIEHNISPPMSTSVSIPMKTHGKHAVIYVATSGFTPSEMAANEEELKFLAHIIVMVMRGLMKNHRHPETENGG